MKERYNKHEVNEEQYSSFPFRTKKINCTIEDYIKQVGDLRLDEYEKWSKTLVDELQKKRKE